MVLQQASVVGRVFWDRVLAYLNQSGDGELEEAKILDGLNGLRDKEMVFRLELSAFAGANEHIFKHALLREVTYESVLKRVRRAYHALVADWLISQSGERAAEITGLIADHLQQAGKDSEAAEYLLQAGDRARELYAHQEAIDSYRRALEYLKEVGDLERSANTYMKLGLAHHNAFEFDEARQAYDEGFAELRRLSEAPLSANIHASAPHALRIDLMDKRIPALDPASAGDTLSSFYVSQLFSGLLQYASGEVIVPDIAESWEVLDGGRRYIFHLRKDARWSDGHPVTAQDFEYAWKHMLDPATGFGTASLLYDVKDARAYNLAETKDAGEVGVHALDDWTLEVELEKSCSYFLQIVALPLAAPIPRHIVEGAVATWAEPDKIVHNGPFRLEVSSDQLLFRRNPLYHGQFRGNIEEITVPLGSDVPFLRLYESDELDCVLLIGLSKADRRLAQEKHAKELIRSPSYGINMVVFNVTRPPFDDPRVRRALALATDRFVLADMELDERSTAASGGLVPPGLPGHVPDIALPFTPEQARALLAEAGYPGGRNFPRQIALSSDGAWERIFNRQLRSQWQEWLDIDIVFEYDDFANVLQRLEEEMPDLMLSGYSADYPDPDNFLRVALKRFLHDWHHEGYDDLIEKARGLMDHDKRMELYRRAELILVEEAPLFPLFYGQPSFLRKPWLSHLPYTSHQLFLTKDVVIEPHQSGKAYRSDTGACRLDKSATVIVQLSYHSSAQSQFLKPKGVWS